MKKHVEGLWTDDEGTLHLEPGAFLRGRGVADTLEEREKLIDMFKELVREHSPNATLIDEFDAEPPTIP